MTRRGTGQQRQPRQVLDVVCTVCGEGFQASRASALYCSPRCQKLGAARKRLGTRACPICSEEFVPWDAAGRTCSPRCRNTLNSRASAQERGGRRRRTGRPDTYIKVDGSHEHRQVAARTIGRALTADDIVHHVNGSPTDNRPENLRVVTRAEHIAIHRPEMQQARRDLRGY